MMWPLVPLGEVLTLQRRWVDVEPTETYIEIGVRCFGNGIFHKAPRAGQMLGDKRVLSICPGDLVFNNVFAWEGAVALAGPKEAGTIGSHRFVTFTPDTSRCSAEFYRCFFASEPGLEILQRASPGSAGRNRTLGLAQFQQQMIPLPPVEEQRRIVARVDAIASRVAEARRLRNETDAQIAALKANETSRFFVLSEAEAKKTNLRSVVESHDSGWSPQCSEEPAGPGAWGVLKTTCVQWDGFDAKQNKKLLLNASPRAELQVAVGDVLVTRAGPVNRVGVACAVLEPAPNLMLSDKIVRLRLRADVLPRYLALALSSPECQEYFRHGKTGLAESQVNISREKLLALPLRVPPLAEQRRIVAHLDALQAKLDAVGAEQSATAAELDALLPSVLNQAFAGKL